MKKNKMRLLTTDNCELTTKKRGFTLIEILVVCAIIAMLAAIVIVNLEKAQAKSRDVQRKADLSQIAAALEMYKVDNKAYIPEGAAGDPNATCVSADSTYLALLISGSYIPSIPSDPTQTGTNGYHYCSKYNGNAFKVFAYSETIIIPSDKNCSASDHPEVLADAKLKAGEFYDSADATAGRDCRKFQVKSSPEAVNYGG